MIANSRHLIRLLIVPVLILLATGCRPEVDPAMVDAPEQQSGDTPQENEAPPPAVDQPPHHDEPPHDVPQPPPSDDTPTPEPPTANNPPSDNPTPDTPQTTIDPPATNPPQDTSAAKELPLIPRKVFFGNPEKARARLSADGKQLAFLAPVDGVLNVWVGPADDITAAKQVTDDKDRGIRNFFWAYTNKHLLYTQDKNGDEDWHIYAVDLETKKVTDLTPIEKISAQVQEVSPDFPEEILLGINDREGGQLHDIYRVNILTAERELVQENPGFAGFMTDDTYQVRFAITFTPDAGQLYLKPTADAGWEEWFKVDSLDAMTTGPQGFNKEGTKLYFLDSRERNTSALKSLDLETGEEELIAENDRADISGVVLHPTEKTVQAVTFTYAKKEVEILDESVKADFEYLETVSEGEVIVSSRSLDDMRWTVAYSLDNGPMQFYLYDRAKEEASFLFTSHPQLEDLPLAKMHDVVIKSRDGLNLVSYLTLPVNADDNNDGVPNEPLPMVLNVHGGPWARDGWGYNPEHQLLANRGYAVLSVNFRGSTGFGKEFINAANREWAGKMHDDLVDAVDWAIEQGIAAEDKVAIMGGSYGGYATLVGLTYTPDKFACGVDIVGPSSLITLMENPPPYWMPFMPVMKARVGDWESDEGREFLESRSPLNLVDKIQRPLLIAQGAQDPRVKQAEADQIVAAMNESKIPVTYMLFQEEGHGFARPQNRFAFYAVTEAFLAEHLGGRYEPIGDGFESAVFTVPSGEDGAPGLKAALDAR